MCDVKGLDVPAFRVMDLSPTGAWVGHARELSPGQPCVLDLRLNGVEAHVRAHVAWCRRYSVGSDLDGAEEIRYQSGLVFTDLPPPGPRDVGFQSRPHACGDGTNFYGIPTAPPRRSGVARRTFTPRLRKPQSGSSPLPSPQTYG
jgi:hypothetical protein